MSNRLTAAALLLVSLGCATALERRELTGPFDGAWLMSDYRCTEGKLNESGERSRDGIRKGTHRVLTVVAGDTVESTIFEFEKDGGPSPGSRCEIRLRERWVINAGQETITVSESTGQRTPVNYAGEWCQGKHEIPQPRTHGYALKGDTLELKLGATMTSAGTTAKSGCPAGAEVLIYKRVF